jgi:hypothetical protein
VRRLKLRAKLKEHQLPYINSNARNQMMNSIKLEEIISKKRSSLSTQKQNYSSHSSSHQQIELHGQITPRYKTPLENKYERKLKLKNENDFITIPKV